MSEGAPDGDLLDRIGGQITKIGVIVTAVIAINTAVIGCSQRYESQSDHLHAAIRDEENFYKGLFDDYDRALSLPADDERRRARILAIQAMAKRPLPSLDAYALGPFVDGQPVKKAAIDRITVLKADLAALAVNPETSGRQTAAAAQQSVFEADNATNQRQRVGGTVTPVDQAQTARAVAVTQTTADAVPPGVRTFQAKTLAVGSAKGYDIDVFWCAGPNDAAVAADAMNAAQVLATKARAGVSVAPGVWFGRIRLRPVPEALKTTLPFPPNGNAIVSDDSKGDADAAATIRTVLEGSTRQTFASVKSDTTSRWYVSVFVCPAAG